MTMFRDTLKDEITQVDFLPLLAIRTGDTLEVEKWDGPGDLSVPTYAVALFEAPDLTRLDLPISLVCKTTGAVCVGISIDGWGWMSWDVNMKNMVSDLLDKAGARPGEWFKLTISYTNPLR